jgi:hypothetical protein
MANLDNNLEWTSTPLIISNNYSSHRKSPRRGPDRRLRLYGALPMLMMRRVYRGSRDFI